MSGPSPEVRYPLPELLRIMRENHVTRLKLGNMEIECYPSGFVTVSESGEVKPSMEAELLGAKMPVGPEMLFMSGTNPFVADEPVENPFAPAEAEEN